MSSFEKSSKALQALNVNSVSAEVLNYLEAFQADAENFETETRNAVSLLDEEIASTKVAITQLQDALHDPEVADEILAARLLAEVEGQARARSRSESSGGEGEAGTGS